MTASSQAAGREPVVLTRVEAKPTARRGWRDVAVDVEGEAGERVTFAVELASDRPALAAIAEAAVFEPLLAPPTVVLITSDTHRGDHVEFATDSVGARTPTLAALAARGLAFTDAFASSNITVPSHVALMTGRTPKETGVLDNATELAERANTLAEHFAAAGWATFAATSTSLLDPLNAGLGQGFERFSSPGSDDPKARQRSRRLADETLATLESWWPAAEGRPLFVWLHVFDAHSPYGAPEDLLEPYWSAGRDPADPTLPEPVPEHVPEWAAGVRDLDYLRARYKAGASWVDRGLARVLTRERVRRGWVVVTSDHGENLGEHDIWWTHKDVYRQTLHVPLVLAGPGVPSGRSSPTPVRMIDVGRTLLDLCGFSDAEYPGRDLIAIADGRAGAARPRFAVSGRTRSASITWEGFLLVKKLVDHRLGRRGRFVEAGQVELFDLGTDPRGIVDVAAEHPERVAELDAWLERWLAEPSAGLAGETKHDAETRRALAELGYLDEEDE